MIDREQLESIGWEHWYDDFSFGMFTKGKNDDVHTWWELWFDYDSQVCTITEIYHHRTDGEIGKHLCGGDCKHIDELQWLEKEHNIK